MLYKIDTTIFKSDILLSESYISRKIILGEEMSREEG